jgi:hypothetical protein
MKVKFENPTGNKIAARIKGKRITIPPYAVKSKVVVEELSDELLDAFKGWMDHVKSAFPAVQITMFKDGEQVQIEADETPEKHGGASGQSNQGSQKMSYQEFYKAVRTAEKAVNGGWWSVVVEGMQEPIKVRGYDDQNSAVQGAYQEYLQEG